MRKLMYFLVAMVLPATLEAGIEQEIVIFFRSFCSNIYALEFFLRM